MDKSWASAGLSEINFSWNGRGKQEITCPSINLKGLGTQFVKNEIMQWDLWPCRTGENQTNDWRKWGPGTPYWGMRYLSTLVDCHDATLCLFSSFFSDWNFLNFFAGLFSFHSEMTFFLASKTDDTPFSQQWFFSLLSQCILCNHALTLIPFCLTWLLVVHVYLWHYILSSLGPRTVSYLYWYFLKCLACSRCLLNMWLRVKFHVLSPEMYKESLMFFLLTAINQSPKEKKWLPLLTHTFYFVGALDCAGKVREYSWL